MKGRNNRRRTRREKIEAEGQHEPRCLSLIDSNCPCTCNNPENEKESQDAAVPESGA